MKKVPLARIIADSGLPKRKFAELLFPYNQHSLVSLNRILSGKGLLDSTQMYLLANFLAVNVDDLYMQKWYAISKGDDFILKRESKKAIYNVKTGIIKLYSEDTLRHETLITQKCISLKELINYIENKWKD